MTKYRVFHLRDDLSGRFRELPATSVRKQLKPKDYAMVGEIEAANEYAAWQALKSPDAGRRPFTVGDVLEADEGRLRLCQFGGFEDASWYSPELRVDKPPDSQPDPPPGQPPDSPVEQPPEPKPDQPRREPPDSLPEPRREPPAPGSGHPVEEPPPNSPPD